MSLIEKSDTILTKSDKGIEPFLSAILAHEVRNPLGYMKLAVSGLNSLVQDPRGKTFIDIISRGIDQINSTIEQVLYCSDCKKLNLNLINITDEVTTIVENFNKKSIRLITPTICYWYSDCVAFRRLITNLIENAIKATENIPNDPFILVEVKKFDGILLVRILDNGGGFPDGFNEKSIQPGFSLFKRGLGLGLFVCKRLAENLNARLIIKNSVINGRLGAQVNLIFKSV